MPFINFKGAKIHYTLLGRGAPVVLLHGFLGCEKIFHPLANELSRKFLVIIPDLLGHGKSENIGYYHDMGLMADCVHELIIKLKLKNVFFIGHSMGGYVALAFTEKYSRLVKGVCLLNSTPFCDSDLKRIERNKAIRAIKLSPCVYIDLAIINLFSKPHLDQNKKYFDFVLDLAQKTGKRGILAAMEGMKERSDRSDIIKKKRHLFFAIMGRHDSVISDKSLDEMKKILLKKHFFILEDSGHMTFLEEKVKTVKILKEIIYS